VELTVGTRTGFAYFSTSEGTGAPLAINSVNNQSTKNFGRRPGPQGIRRENKTKSQKLIHCAGHAKSPAHYPVAINIHFIVKDHLQLGLLHACFG